jgi:DNA primase
MTRKRFSNQELHSLRNHIPVSFLIESVLDIPCRTTEGVFRFLCPLCSEFTTAVNPNTNLARCFRCQKNFNTIDLVTIVKKTDFLNAVRFLKHYHHKTPDPEIPTPPIRNERNQQPQHIADILKSTVPSPPSLQSPFDSIQHISDRILALEQKLEQLALQVEQIGQGLR